MAAKTLEMYLVFARSNDARTEIKLTNMTKKIARKMIFSAYFNNSRVNLLCLGGAPEEIIVLRQNPILRQGYTIATAATAIAGVVKADMKSTNEALLAPVEYICSSTIATIVVRNNKYLIIFSSEH
jgi:hypothetical protein